MSYDDDVHPYTDLVLGRVDAVLLDNVLADRRTKTMAGFTTQPESVATGHYVGVLAPADAPLRDASTRSCAGRCATARSSASSASGRCGTRISRALYAQVLAGEPVAPVEGPASRTTASHTRSRWDDAPRYLPSLLRASAITLVLSCLAMALAVVLGVLDRERARLRLAASLRARAHGVRRS